LARGFTQLDVTGTKAQSEFPQWANAELVQLRVDSTLTFRRWCHEGICGCCTMNIASQAPLCFCMRGAG